MATITNGKHVNGGPNGYGVVSPGLSIMSKRFSDIPSAIDIPVQGDDDEQAVEVDLEDLLDDPTELCTLLENEGAARQYWMTVSLAYAKQKKVDHAIEMLLKGGQAVRGGNKEKLSMLACLCWMYLWKSREAPRVASEGDRSAEPKTKDYYHGLATSTLNEASRINPSFPPLYLARGVLQLLKASLENKPRPLKPNLGNDVCWDIGKPRKCTDDDGNVIKTNKIRLHTFKEWLQVTSLIKPPSRKIRTAYGSLILDEEFQNKLFLRGLLLLDGSVTGKPFRFGYDLASGKTDRDRGSISNQEQEGRLITKLVNEALRTSGEEQETLLKRYAELIQDSNQKYADISGARYLTEHSASLIWTYLVDKASFLSSPGFYYDAHKESDVSHSSLGYLPRAARYFV